MRSDSANHDPNWDLYAAHRKKFTRAVLSVAPGTPGRLCVVYGFAITGTSAPP